MPWIICNSYELLHAFLIFRIPLAVCWAWYAGYAGQNITQINIYGKLILLLLEENTKERTLRRVWPSITKFSASIAFPIYYLWFYTSMVLSFSDYVLFEFCSFGIKEDIRCGAVIMSLHLSQRTLLSLVLYTAMETGFFTITLDISLPENLSLDGYWACICSSKSCICCM